MGKAIDSSALFAEKAEQNKALKEAATGEKQPKILHACTLVLMDVGSTLIVPETQLGGGTFQLDWDKAYRMVCDVKSIIEAMRVTACLGLTTAQESQENTNED